MKNTIQFLLKSSLFLSLVFSSLSLQSQEVTTYYLIRHAEKEVSDKSNRNPHLTEVGKERALAWKAIFKEVAFDKIYSTAYHRTEETAAPTATDQQLVVEGYDPRNLYNAAFQSATQGKTVLVVGHSNTTPVLANKILGKETYANIDESIHGNLYIIQRLGDAACAQLLSLE